MQQISKPSTKENTATETSAPAELKTNLNTNFIKIVAIAAMTVDHIGTAFFPDYPIFRWIGRIAFPLFAIV